MANPFANSYVENKTQSGVAKNIPVWIEVAEVYPGGALVKPTETLTVGTVLPAATPITVTKFGAAPTLDGEAPTGYTWHDAIIGENGAPVDIVTKGALAVSRVASTITEAQKTATAARILMVEE
jgi:hypothetical protein